MVQMTPQEYEEMKRKENAPKTTSWQREVVGNSARIDIPLDDIYALRKIGPVLAGLAERITAIAHRHDIPEGDILMMLRYQISYTVREIRTLHGGANKQGIYPKRR